MKKTPLLLITFLYAFMALAQETNDNLVLNNLGISYDSIINYLSRTDISLDDKVMMARKGVAVLTPYDKTTRVFSIVLKEAQKEENPTVMTQFYCAIANNYLLDARMTEAKAYLDSAATHVPGIENNEALGMYYYLLGMYHTHMGDQDAGHEAYYKAINHYEAAGNKLQIVLFLLYDIAVPYVFRDDHIGLQPIARKMLDTARQLKTDEGYLLAYQLMGYYHDCVFESTHDSIQLDSVAYYHRQAIDTYENGSELLKAIAVNQIFDSYNILLKVELSNEQPQWNTVLAYANKSLEHATPTDTAKIAKIHLTKSNAYMKRNNADEAEKEAKEALRLIQLQSTGSSNALLAMVYKAMANAYAAKNNHRAAYQYEQLRSDALKEVYNAQRYETIKELETKYQTEKKELEISHLRAENEYQSRLRLWHWIAIVLLAGLTAFIYQWQRTKGKLVANRLRVTELEKEEIELNLSLKEEQATRAELEKYEALLEVHFKELQIEGKESELSSLRTEKEELDQRIKAYTDRLQEYENATVTDSAEPTVENWKVVRNEMAQLINKRFKGASKNKSCCNCKRLTITSLPAWRRCCPMY